ncbi:MAG: serine/threonine-protein kinase [Planctomycetota bacterium]
MNSPSPLELETLFLQLLEHLPPSASATLAGLPVPHELRHSLQCMLLAHESALRRDFLGSGWMDSDPGRRTPRVFATAEDLRGEPALAEYTIEEALGQGASSIVFRARSKPPLVREVAIKVQHGDANAQQRTRFRMEQQALASLHHPGIAQVFDQGELTSGALFTVLEFVDGEPITTWCRRQNHDWRKVAALVADCCDALTHVHDRGLIHRDLKPSNILVTEQGGHPQPKLIDFGIAKVKAAPVEVQWPTGTGDFLGTLPYSSPEQITGSGDISVRSDGYALGIVLYECLTGLHPFAGEFGDIRGLVRSICDGAVPSLPSALGRPGPEWNAILRKATAGDPSVRYPAASDLGTDLRRLLRNLPVRAMRRRPIYVARKFLRRHWLAIPLVLYTATPWIIRSVTAVRETHRQVTAFQTLKAGGKDLAMKLHPLFAELDGSSEIGIELLNIILPMIETLQELDPDDPEVRFFQVYAWDGLGDAAMKERDLDAALALFSGAREIALDLRESSLPPVDVDRAIARLTIKVGDVAKQQEDYDEALRNYIIAHGIFEEHKEAMALEMAWSYERISAISRKRHEKRDALLLAQDRWLLSKELLECREHDWQSRYNWATANFMLCDSLHASYQYQPALDHALTSEEVALGLIRSDPQRYSSHLAVLNAEYAKMMSYYYLNRPDEGDRAAEEALETIVDLVERNPSRLDTAELACAKISGMQKNFAKYSKNRDKSELDGLLREMRIHEARLRERSLAAQ